MIRISTDTLAALVALTSVGVGSECRGEQEAATITRCRGCVPTLSSVRRAT